jgi:hypothetical protein
MSFGISLAAFHSRKAPTLLVEVMKSPDTLSTHDNADIPVDYLSNIITLFKDSIENNINIPST